MIPHGARSSGMAYWQKRAASEKGNQRKPKPTADKHTEGSSESGVGEASWDGGSSGGLLEGGNGEWEDEKEEV